MNSSSGPTGLNTVADATLRSYRARWNRPFATAALLGLFAALAGCGSGSTNINMAVAFSELGQPNFNSSTANGGQNTVNGTGLSTPLGAVATDGTHFYVVDTNNNRVLGYNKPPLSPSTAPDFVLGQSALTTRNAGANANQMSAPDSVHISVNPINASVQLVVADTGNNRVLIWNTLPTATATAADVVVGQTAFGGGNNAANGGAAAPSATTLKGPVDAAIANGKLFVSDTGNDRVLIYSTIPTANGAAADLVLGQPDMVTDQAACIGSNQLTPCTNPSSGTNIGNYVNGNTQMHQPNGLYTDGYKLLVADTANNRVLYWSSIPVANGAGAGASNVVGLNAFGTFSSAGSNGPTGLRVPTGVGSGLAGFYVADSGNNRVLYFSTFPNSNGPAASAVYGQSDFTHSAQNDDNQDGIPDAPNNGTSGTGSIPTNRTLFTPTAVSAFNGVVYIADSGNNRIMEYAGQ
ncbi:MAG: hypothetical protein ACRESS_11125 [Stenotrophobium sp.]